MATPSTRPHPFWHPIRRRRFDSALIVLLSRHWFPRLGALEQAQVDGELADVFKQRNLDPYPVWRDIVGASSDRIALLRGIAMARLDWPTGVDGLAWNDVVRPSWRRQPVMAIQAFRNFDAATDEAIDFLKSKGLALDDSAGHGLRWMNEMRARFP